MDANESALQLLAISRIQPLSYNHDTREFHFGDQIKSIDEIPQFGTPHEGGEDLTVDDVRTFMETTPYVYSYVHPISLPRSSDFFEQGWSDTVAQETREIMADVFFEHADRFVPSERERLMELRSFDTLRRTQPGDVILNTLGNCACLGPDYTAHVTLSDAGIMEYTFHNTDRFEQKLSLMAGLGHVARRATEWLAVQDYRVRR